MADNDYARRFLCTHLAGAGWYSKLFTLVAQSNRWAEARYRVEENYLGYLTDLALAWQWAESDGWNVGFQIRCALIESSIRSLAGHLPSDLLCQAVEASIWSPGKALTRIQEIPEERQRAEALVQIAPLLPDGLITEALKLVETLE